MRTAPVILVVLATSTPLPSDASTTTIPVSLLAIDVLASIPVQNEHPAGFDRARFGYPASTGDGCDTRAEVLLRDSLTPAQVDPAGCAVVAGDWYSAYDGVTWSDPAELEIDHVVALKEAHDSGAWAWVDERLVAFANDLQDPRSLRAVTAAVNRDKGDADPSNWLPPDETFVCEFLADWVAIKARWGLSMDQSEHGRVRNVLTDRCPDQTVAPWPYTPPPVRTATTTTTTTSTTPSIQQAVAVEPSGDCDPAYPDACIPPPPPDLDCGDIEHREFTVLPPDPHRFDGDGDGIGCQPRSA